MLTALYKKQTSRRSGKQDGRSRIRSGHSSCNQIRSTLKVSNCDFPFSSKPPTLIAQCIKPPCKFVCGYGAVTGGATDVAPHNLQYGAPLRSLCLLQPVSSGTDGQYRMQVDDSKLALRVMSTLFAARQTHIVWRCRIQAACSWPKTIKFLGVCSGKPLQVHATVTAQISCMKTDKAPLCCRQFTTSSEPYGISFPGLCLVRPTI